MLCPGAQNHRPCKPPPRTECIHDVHLWHGDTMVSRSKKCQSEAWLCSWLSGAMAPSKAAQSSSSPGTRADVQESASPATVILWSGGVSCVPAGHTIRIRQHPEVWTPKGNKVQGWGYSIRASIGLFGSRRDAELGGALGRIPAAALTESPTWCSGLRPSLASSLTDWSRVGSVPKDPRS